MVFVVGLVGVLLFYLIVLGFGIWASLKFPAKTEVDTMNAGRSLGVLVGTITLIATWVGGSYITGTAERVYSRGLVNCQVPVGYSVALVVGAQFFTARMRKGGYVTLMDPFQLKYGNIYGALLILPCIAAEFFWVASVLNSLGASLQVILGTSAIVSIAMSALFAGLYPLIGGLVSVTYTDVVVMIMITFGMVLSVGFAWGNIASEHHLSNSEIFGEIKKEDIPVYIDDYIILILGGIPWQGYFQRIFSIKSTSLAVKMSWFSAIGTLILGIPAILIGIVAKKTDWSEVKGFHRPIKDSDASLVMPLVLRYLTPAWVAFFGLGAVCGGVMASADSAILASSAMVTRNVYKNLFRPKASDKELHWILRVSIVIITILTSIIAATVTSVYYLSFICSDIVYVVVFPQLILLMYCENFVNGYGSMASYVFGMVFRGLAGEPGLGLPTVMKYPWYDEKEDKQRFPFRSLIMVCSLIILVCVSAMTNGMYKKGWIKKKCDFMKAFYVGRTNEDEEPQQSS